MTGFGKASAKLSSFNINIEIKSVNSKQFDLNLKMPGTLRELENEYRQIISQIVERGKVDVFIRLESAQGNSEFVNTKLAKAYHEELKKLCKVLKLDDKNLLEHVLKLPELYQNKEQNLSKSDLVKVSETLKKALNDFSIHRRDEGKELEKDIVSRVKQISALLKVVEKVDITRAPKIREKIKTKISELVKKDDIDNNRLEQEIIFYLERNDITEEKIRLQTHCDYFIKTAKENSSGRKLAFIAQEIGREINTIGSKANDAELQMLVVQMKDELEKIKEQLNNIL